MNHSLFQGTKIFAFIWSSFLFLQFQPDANAQLSFGVSYPLNQSTYVLETQRDYISLKPKFSVEYAFLPWKKRIQIAPFLQYMPYTYETSKISPEIKLNIHQLGLGVVADIYPLDINGDCMCPTWNQSGKLIEKGFFIRVGGGVIYQKIPEFITNDGNTFKSMFQAQGIVGLGLDLGLSKLLTITPLVTLSYNDPYYVFHETIGNPEPVAVLTEWLLINPGLRLLFHFKE